MVSAIQSGNRVTVPAHTRRTYGIAPGHQLVWQPVEGTDVILVRIVPTRRALARRLLGAGRRFSPERDAVAERIAERAADG